MDSSRSGYGFRMKIIQGFMQESRGKATEIITAVVKRRNRIFFCRLCTCLFANSNGQVLFRVVKKISYKFFCNWANNESKSREACKKGCDLFDIPQYDSPSAVAHRSYINYNWALRLSVSGKTAAVSCRRRDGSGELVRGGTVDGQTAEQNGSGELAATKFRRRIQLTFLQSLSLRIPPQLGWDVLKVNSWWCRRPSGNVHNLGPTPSPFLIPDK